MDRNKDFYLRLIYYALIEIRGTDDNKRATLAYALANILHNLPLQLALEWTEEKEEEAYATIKSRAAAHNLVALIESWERTTPAEQGRQ